MMKSEKTLYDSMPICFSILVPVFNVEMYIDECIQSVLTQTYNRFELILVDDGSTDSSGLICDRYAEEYSNIQVYHKPNQGLIHTRSYAIERATGSYYVFLDSDDKLERNALQVLAETISKHGCDCVFYNFSKLIDGEKCESTYRIQEGYVTDKRVILKRMLVEMPIEYNGLWIKCVKAVILSHMDYSEYYHIQYTEDLLRSLEILERCSNAEFIDAHLYIYRIRSGSITSSRPEDRSLADNTVRKQTLQYVLSEGLFTSDDLNEYRDKCIGLFVNQLIGIGLSRNSYTTKKSAYKTIRRDEYYKGFLRKGISNKSAIGVKGLIYYLFRIRLDALILFIIGVYKKVKGRKRDQSR